MNEQPRPLTDEQIEESIRFDDAANAAEGHFAIDPESTADIRRMLRGEITEAEYNRRAL